MKELDEIKAMNTAYITPAVAATVCKMDPNSLRWLAHNNPSELPFPVEIAGKQGTRVRIPRLAFIAAYEPQEKPDIEDTLDKLTRMVNLIAAYKPQKKASIEEKLDELTRTVNLIACKLGVSI